MIEKVVNMHKSLSYIATFLVLTLQLFIGSIFAQHSNPAEMETPWEVHSKEINHNHLEGVTIESYFEHEKPVDCHAGCKKDCARKCCGREGGGQHHLGGRDGDGMRDLKDYQLKAGDKVLISVYGEANSKRIVTVNPGGSISYLVVNDLAVKGMNLEQLRTILQGKLETYYRTPLLIITPIFFSGEYYTVLGEVMIPGVKLYAGYPTVTTALCQAGGFTTRLFRDQTLDQVDLDHSFLSRQGHYIPVDFRKLVEDGDMSQDAPLQPGDYIHVAHLRLSRVWVLGEVGGATSVIFVDSLSLTQAIAEAGGLSPYASSRVAVLRGSLSCPERFLVDVNRIIKGCACDFPLEPGDIVYVPTMQYTTLKEIVRAGVAYFVSFAASIAGAEAFIAVQPQAAITGVISPVPIIGTSVGGIISTPGAGFVSPGF